MPSPRSASSPPSPPKAPSGTARNPTRWVGLSPDDRRAERRELLLDAAFELLGGEGWSATTLRGVCQAARLNPRYFYESFADLDELVVAVYDRLVEQLSLEILEAMQSADDDPESQTRAAIGTIVGFVDDDRRRGRVLYVEALGNEALNRRRIETGHALVAAVEQYGIERHGPPPKGEAIGRVAAALLVGGTSELIIAWFDGRIDVERQQLVDDATALFLAVGEAAADLAARRAR